MDRPSFPGYSECSLFAVHEQALAVKSSDVVVLTDKTASEARAVRYTIIEYWDALDDFAESNLKPLAVGTVDGIPYRVLVRAVPRERKPE